MISSMAFQAAIIRVQSQKAIGGEDVSYFLVVYFCLRLPVHFGTVCSQFLFAVL